jgi:hypothetical protein
VAGALFGGLLLVVCAFAWLSFDDETRAKFTIFQRGTLLFMGLLAFSAWFALVRSRVVADEQKLTVVNGYRKREFEWPEIVAVHLPPGAPWATLDLSDGSTTTALAIQGSDGARAHRAVRQLRALVNRPR